jgi:UDP-N-acetylglucosamine--N-acetylmuramyl-(pentapeptide) pyrophosphoryl-undecaprenol N-acetylglucosamine transferase
MLTTGGTGGHVFPGLAVAGKLAARGAHVFWLGTRDGIEAKLVPQHDVDFEAVSFRGVRGRDCGRCCSVPFALLAACLDARRIIGRRKP